MVGDGLNLPIYDTIGCAEFQSIDAFVENLIARHSTNSEMMNLMTLEATSLVTSVESRSRNVEGQNRLVRLWNEATGKNQKIAARNDRDLAQSQYIGQQMLNKLAENNLMTYQMVVSLGDNVNRVVDDVNDTRLEVAAINQTLATFFSGLRQKLEQKFTPLERGHDLHRWKEIMMVEAVYQNKKYSELSRSEKIVCLANDFYCHSQQQWGPKDLVFLKSILLQVGHDPDEKMKLKEVFQSYQQDQELLEQLFKNVDPAPELSDVSEITPTLLTFNKLQSLENEESYVLDTVTQYAPTTSREELALELASNFIANETGRNLNHEVPIFDVVMNFIEDIAFHQALSKAKKEICTDTNSETQFLEPSSKHEVADTIAIDLSISSASLGVHENGGTTLLKVIDDCWLDPDDELKFQQEVRVLLTDFLHVAEVYRGGEIYSLVVTTPSNFSTRQQLAIREVAASLGNKYAVSFTNRATAVALAALEANIQESIGFVVICDVRGSTLDLSVIEHEYIDGEHQFEVLATNGAPYNAQTKLPHVATSLLQQTLEAAGCSAEEIDKLIVSGESNVAESAKKGLQDFLRKPAMKLADAAVTPLAGAASLLGRVYAGDLTNVLLLDVTNHDIGVEVCDGSVMTIMEKDTTIPSKKSNFLTTIHDKQASMVIHVVEDNSSSGLLRKSLGYFELTGIQAAPAGMPKIEITMDLDSNKVMTVYAKDKSSTSCSYTLIIDSLSKGLPLNPVELNVWRQPQFKPNKTEHGEERFAFFSR
mgnify:CR=1 FL=1